MRLERLVAEDRPDGRRIAARVVWEGPRRGPDLLWFETDARFAADFEPAPEAFLVAALPLAAGLGEPRLRVEGRVCDRLRTGLEAAARRLAAWYPSCRPVPIEATEGFGSLAPRTPPRAASFLSGGVDSLSLLRRNRLDVAPDDPRAIRDAIHLFGWHTDDFDGATPRPARLREHAAQRARLEAFAATTDLTVLPVRTNCRTFHPSFAWSRDVAFGAGMIAVAHAFRRRCTEVTLASGGFPGVHPAHGSHPELDPLFSSSSVEVHHGELDRTRLEKVRAVAAWDAALAVLEVCLHRAPAAPGEVNCGTCEKCVRTRLALTAIGAAARAPTFPARDLAPDDVRRMAITPGFGVAFVEELTAPLTSVGRADLVAALHDAIRRTARKEARRRGPWRRWLRWVRGRRDARAT